MIIVMFDLNEPRTFDTVISHWLKEIREFADENVIVLLVGNKSDLEWKLDRAMLKSFAEENKLNLEIISCTKGTNIQATWNSILKMLVEKFDTHHARQASQNKPETGLKMRSAIEPENVRLEDFKMPERKSEITECNSILENINGELEGSNFSRIQPIVQSKRKKRCCFV